MNDIEIEVMGELVVSLMKLEAKPEAQQRAIKWVCERFNFSTKAIETSKFNNASSNTRGVDFAQLPSDQFAGIAEISPDGDFVLTLRDLKAKSQLDAARRLIHIAIFTYSRLVKVPDMPSKELTKILKDWRVYDGNVRALISKSKGLIRTKDGGLALDAHSKNDAELFISEILNSEIKGLWAPGKNKK